MFIPYLIALFLGLINPSDSSNNNCNSQVVTTQDDGDTDPSNDDGTGGETGQIPPPKIN